ncbi:MAG: MogA/MoaB family molybdenum cofactor biosynthesis protein [Anaerovoracaceae bacterium]|nr:MogA/MoaB family molybdenum cofactor biosynthesis protein [Anaerovoracaceae bacterium]
MKADRYDRYKVGIITLSDKGSQGLREDQSGPAIRQMLEADGGDSDGCGTKDNGTDDRGQKGSRYQVVEELLLPDEPEQLKAALIRMSDEDGLDLILTTGGTGFSPRDRTPEATMEVATRNAPGIAEYMRAKSFEITPKAMLSRSVSVIRNATLIINLPGSPKAVRENLGFILPALDHGLDILLGRDGECGSETAGSGHAAGSVYAAGSVHAAGGSLREVSFIDTEIARWLREEAPEDGLCLKRFHADYELDGVCGWKTGDRVEISGPNGEKLQFEVTITGKKCFPECRLLQRTGEKCPLVAGVAFGRHVSVEK